MRKEKRTSNPQILAGEKIARDSSLPLELRKKAQAIAESYIAWEKVFEKDESYGIAWIPNPEGNLRSLLNYNTYFRAEIARKKIINKHLMRNLPHHS